MAEPFHLSLEQIGNLTLTQVNRIYFHPRDKQGSILRVPTDSEMSKDEEDRFYSIWRARGLPDRRIKQLWTERLAKEQPANGFDDGQVRRRYRDDW